MTIKQTESKIRKLAKQREAARRQGMTANAHLFDEELRTLKREYKVLIQKTQMVLPGFEIGVS